LLSSVHSVSLEPHSELNARQDNATPFPSRTTCTTHDNNNKTTLTLINLPPTSRVFSGAVSSLPPISAAPQLIPPEITFLFVNHHHVFIRVESTVCLPAITIWKLQLTCLSEPQEADSSAAVHPRPPELRAAADSSVVLPRPRPRPAVDFSAEHRLARPLLVEDYSAERARHPRAHHRAAGSLGRLHRRRPRRRLREDFLARLRRLQPARRRLEVCLGTRLRPQPRRRNLRCCKHPRLCGDVEGATLTENSGSTPAATSTGGGLFGAASSTQPSTAPATTTTTGGGLFGGASTTTPAAGTSTGGGLFGGGATSTFGGTQQQQQMVPAATIDHTKLSPTSRFSDCHPNVQLTLESIEYVQPICTLDPRY
jgi:hypothetical protein